MTAVAAPRKRSASKSPRRAAPVAVEDASPSLIAKLGGEVRTFAAWIAGVLLAGGLVWGLFDKVAEQRSAADAATARLAAVQETVLRLSGEVTALVPRIAATEAMRAELAVVRQQTDANTTSIATARTTRDQQYEGIRDQVRVMQQADAQQNERAQQLAQTLGTIATRIEDMLRRMEGVERRLDRSLYLPPPAQRGDAPRDEPAAWWPLHIGS